MHFMNDLVNSISLTAVRFDLWVVGFGVDVPSRSVPAAN